MTYASLIADFHIFPSLLGIISCKLHFSDLSMKLGTEENRGKCCILQLKAEVPRGYLTLLTKGKSS